jgi:hypothetical protein
MSRSSTKEYIQNKNNRKLQAKDSIIITARRQMTSTSIKSGDIHSIHNRCQQDQQEAIRQLVVVAQKLQRSNLRSKPSKETSLSPYTKLGQARTPS